MPLIFTLFNKLQTNHEYYKKWCRHNCPNRHDKPRAETICFLLTKYVLEQEAFEIHMVERIDNSRDLYLVNFLNKSHTFFWQGGYVLHSFRNRHGPKLERVNALRRAINTRKLGSIARHFNALPIAVHHNDGYDIFHRANEMNRQFALTRSGDVDENLKIYQVVCRTV